MSTTTTLNVVLSEVQEEEPAEIVIPNTGILSSSNTGIFFGGFAILVVAAFVISRLMKHKSSTNFHIKKKKTLAVSLLAILALPALINVLNNLNLNQTNSASAIRAATLTDDLLEVTATSAGTLTLDAGILGTEELAYVKDTITVSEEVSGPYTIYLTASDNKLVHESNPNLVIPSITEAGELTDKSFGYTIGNPAEQQNVTWNPVTTEKTAIIKSGASLKDKTFDVYYAVRAKDLDIAGTYKLDLNYTLTIDFDGTMQGMSSAICERMELETPYTVKDARDDKDYEVIRLKDNNCYMRDDLQLKLSTEKTFTSADTDLHSKDSWTPNYNTIYRDADGNAYSDPEHQHELDEESFMNEMCGEYNSPQECYYHADINMVYEGEYAYNGAAALVHPSIPNTYIDELDNAEVITAPDSICPKGWQLLGSDIPQVLDAAYGLHDITSQDEFIATVSQVISLLNINLSNDNSFILPTYLLNEYYAGYHDGDMVFAPKILMVKGTGSFFKIREDVNGMPLRVRCTTRRTGFAHLNIEGIGESTLISAEFSDDGKGKIIIPSSTPTRDGYTFIGYSTTENGVAEYHPGDTITVTGRNATLHAVWAKSVPDAAYLQDITSGICSSLELGELYALKDRRDEKTYTISRVQYYGTEYASCWMMDDIDFQTEEGTYSPKSGVRFYSRQLTDDVCPSGWIIPSAGEYNDVYGDDWQTNILRIALNGMYDPNEGKIKHAGEVGDHFTETGIAYFYGFANAYMGYDGAGDESSQYYLPVRCALR